MGNVYDELAKIVPHDREVVIVCVGTDRSTGDAFGPLVGTALKAANVPCAVYGTLDEPVHAVNVVDVRNRIAQQHEGAYVIAVDACLGKFDSIGQVKVYDEPLEPGKGVKKAIPPIGNCSVIGTVNVAGFMEYFVLQNTRLGFVMQLVEEAVQDLAAFMFARQEMVEVAATFG